MRCGILLVLSGGLVAALLMAGCADVSATQKVGDFGTAFGASADEQKAIDWFRQTYGDPQSNNDQPARFIEPLVTTGISDKNMPVNKVTIFPVSGGSVYFFVIYDNFAKGDPITVTWTYIENNKEVTRVQKAAGGDFGRFIVEFQKPDSGWGKGLQQITVSGKGASAYTKFSIGDTLATTPLPYNPAPVTVTTVPATTSPTTAIPACAAGLTLCSGTCRNLASDQDNCGSCGQGCDPELGLVCSNGICVTGTATTTQVTTIPTLSDSVPCDAPLSLCYGRCTDLNTDINNCGGCGFPCASNSGTISTCTSGQCQVSCKSGYADCDGKSYNGCEVRTMTDSRHCGACGRECSQTNGVGMCDNGVCRFICNTGFENCNGLGSDGCEVNIMTDVRNCGSCGNWCPRRASDSAIPYCTQGQCTY